MSGAGAFLSGLVPSPAPRAGAPAGTPGAAARTASGDDGSVFAAALVGALLGKAPAEVQGALGRLPTSRAPADGDGGRPAGEGDVPSVDELLARVEARLPELVPEGLETRPASGDAADAAKGHRVGVDIGDGDPGAASARRLLAELESAPAATRRLLTELATAASPSGGSSGRDLTAAPGELSSPVELRRLMAGMGAAPGPAPAVPEVSTTGAAPEAVHVADRDPTRLHPELQARLARVQERMASEHGHRVELAEGVRTAARQDHLFAQGRSRPGDIVTWTRASKHETGHAADVMIDGGWDDPAAFRRLQRIAREEGLVTLGPRDPGHLELPGSGGLRSASAHAAGEGRSPGRETAPRPVGPARAARVAGTATVASVARPGVGVYGGGDSGAAPAPRPEATVSPEPYGIRPDFDALRRVVAVGADAGGGSRGGRSASPAPPPAPTQGTFGAPGREGASSVDGAVRTPVESGPPSAASRASSTSHPAPQTTAASAPASSPAPAPSSPAVSSPSTGPTPAPSPASPPAPAPTAPPAPGPDAASPGAATLSGAGGSGAQGGDAGASFEGRRESRRDGAESGRVQEPPRAAPGREREAFTLDAGRSSRAGNTQAPAPVGDVGGSTSAARAEQIAELRDQALNLRGDRVNLRVEHPDGEVTRIRMGSADRRVDAELRATDPLHARRLRQEVAELSARLEEQGLRLGDVAVRDLRMPGRAEAGVQSSGLESVLRQGLAAGSESSDSGATGRDAQQRQQDRQDPDFGSGRHRRPREEFTPGDDSPNQTPWESWKEDLR